MGAEILLVASCYGNQDMPLPDGPFGLYTDYMILNSVDISSNFVTMVSKTLQHVQHLTQISYESVKSNDMMYIKIIY